MKAAIYLFRNPGDSRSTNQRSDLLTLVHARGWQLVGEYEDVGCASWTVRRTGLERLLADAKKRRFEAVIVWNLSRIAPEIRKVVHTIHRLSDSGLRFISLMDGIDTGGPSGEALRKLVTAFVGLERDISSERIREGISRARKTGKRLGRPTKEVDMQRVIRLRDAGMSIRRIAAASGLSKSRVADLLRRKRTSTPTRIAPEVSQNPAWGSGQGNMALRPTPEVESLLKGTIRDRPSHTAETRRDLWARLDEKEEEQRPG